MWKQYIYTNQIRWNESTTTSNLKRLYTHASVMQAVMQAHKAQDQFIDLGLLQFQT